MPATERDEIWGNLKLEFAGSEQGSRAIRTKDEALETAKHTYKGVVDLDHHGNMVFESYEAGRTAQKDYVEKRHADHTVEQLIREYSKPDYSGAVHYDAQAKDIHAVAAAEGQDLHGKNGPAVGALQTDLAALGITARDGSAIHPDSHFGPHTKEAVEAFQAAHGLKADGVAGPATTTAIGEAKGHMQAAAQAVPTLLDARHPAHGIYEQAHSRVAHLDQEQGRASGPHTQNFAGSLTSAATSAGLNRIDHVALSDDANRGYAIQGELNSPFKRYVGIEGEDGKWRLFGPDLKAPPSGDHIYAARTGAFLRPGHPNQKRGRE